MVDRSVTSCNVYRTVAQSVWQLQETAGSDGQWAFSTPMRQPRFVTKRLGKNFLQHHWACHRFNQIYITPHMFFLYFSWVIILAFWMILALSHQQPELVCRRCSRGGRISKNKPAMTSELCWARRDLQPHFRQSVWQDCNAWDGLEKDLKFISQISQFSMCFLNLVCHGSIFSHQGGTFQSQVRKAAAFRSFHGASWCLWIPCVSCTKWSAQGLATSQKRVPWWTIYYESASLWELSSKQPVDPFGLWAKLFLHK